MRLWTALGSLGSFGQLRAALGNSGHPKSSAMEYAADGVVGVVHDQVEGVSDTDHKDHKG